MSNESALQKVADELAARIGQLTSNYEGQIAVIKVQAEEQIESLRQRCSELEQGLVALRELSESEPEPQLDKPADD